jgi:hypothetical protein
MTPASSVPGRMSTEASVQDLHDLVRALAGARDEHLERADDRGAAVPRSLGAFFEPVAEPCEPLSRLRARDCVELGARQGQDELAMRGERSPQVPDVTAKPDEAGQGAVR